MLPMQGVQIQSLVREIRSHIPRGQKPKLKGETILQQIDKDFKNGPHQKQKKTLKKIPNFICFLSPNMPDLVFIFYLSNRGPEQSLCSRIHLQMFLSA